jgi:hypothetical protein
VNKRIANQCLNENAHSWGSHNTCRMLSRERTKDTLFCQAFVHLSTAFCHCDLEVLEEKLYQSPLDPHDVMRCVQWMDDATLDLITER